ncbi:MAG: NAD-dependent epimerase/dehydratase family protein, partial [Marmoricola sp.]
MTGPGTRTALIAGATGLVGSHLLDQLLADPYWDAVVCVGRRPVDRTGEKLEQLIVSFPDIGEVPAADDVFSCLGTTIKLAGSQEAFRAVDHDAVVNLAAAAQAAGASQFLHVTALGASAGSRIFYNRVK